MGYNDICLYGNLLDAWKAVKQKGSGGGIDMVSVKEFERDLSKNIDELSCLLTERKYIPEPYKQLSFTTNNKTRQLNLPAVKDKIVQQAVKLDVEQRFERVFQNCSYAYRATKGTAKAIGRVRHIIAHEKREWVVKCDIANYFDSVCHDLLFEKVRDLIPDKDIQQLIEMWTKVGTVNYRKKWNPTDVGIAQGGIISPLLSNLYLNDFDKAVLGRGYGMVRYSDDFIVLTKSEKEAKEALNFVREYLHSRLRLKIKPDYFVNHHSVGFEYLGLWFDRDNVFSISDKRLCLLADKMRQSVKLKNGGLDAGFYFSLHGVKRYYGELLSQEALERIDAKLIEVLEVELTALAAVGDIKFKVVREQLRKEGFFSDAYRKNAAERIDGLLKNVSAKPTPPPPPPQEAEVERKVKKSVNVKKRQYQRLEMKDSEIVVAANGISLGRAKNAVSVRQYGKPLSEVQAQNLRNITIMADGVSITAGLIRLCAERQIKISFMEYNGHPYATLSTTAFAETQVMLAQTEAFNNGRALEAMRTIIIGKIVNQMNMLKYLKKSRLNTALNSMIDNNIVKMENTVAEARNYLKTEVDEARNYFFSCEGRAAAAYWEVLTGVLQRAGFEKRITHGADDLVNSMFNYGYGILYSRVWEAVIKAGLNPNVSYLHKYKNKRPSLVFDLIEEFRQHAVDRVVIAMINKGEKITLKDGFLDEPTRKRLAEKVTERLSKYETFRGKDMTLTQIIYAQAINFVDYLTGKFKTYKTYYMKW